MKRHGSTKKKEPPRTFITQEARHAARTSPNVYPRLVTELTRAEVKQLTEVLHLDNTHDHASQQGCNIQKMIEALPKRLRKEWSFSMRSIQSRWQPSTLCEVHRSLNPDLINDILRLVQNEVTVHLRKFEAFPQLVGSVEQEILSSLQALKGMWTRPGAGRPVAPMAWAYQINGCAACIVARIAADKYTVRSLFVVLQSRTRTCKKHRLCRLMPFIDESLNRFGAESDGLHGTANQLANTLKLTRKRCIRAWHEDPNREHRSQHHKNGKTTSKHHNDSHALKDILPRPDPSSVVSPQITPVPVKNPGRSGQATVSSSSQNGGAPRNIFWDKRPQRSIAAGPASRNISRQTIPERPVNPEPPRTIPSPAVPNPRRALSQAQAHSKWGSDIDEQIDELIQSYQTLGVQDKSLSSRSRNPSTITPAEPRMGEQRRCTKTSTKRCSEFPSAQHHQSTGSVEVPLVYQYSPSEYSDSDWTDVPCEDEGYQPPRRQWDPSPAMTTWSLVCDEGNVI
ncbi:hypothetical protein N7474_004627 [Penicillium riverlandense]|uniref:uncharacterized protein n=1 Tax=Penicillium riverlandense TaxID=1903569 RepID=UPI0025468D6A|nr:uncharacterized protein N7474_004627 [Penicillium riverlandense]KAJ5819036.1 hypothetical protein N7474_004627 [Penicillium riverlandense]